MAHHVSGPGNPQALCSHWWVPGSENRQRCFRHRNHVQVIRTRDSNHSVCVGSYPKLHCTAMKQHTPLAFNLASGLVPLSLDKHFWKILLWGCTRGLSRRRNQVAGDLSPHHIKVWIEIKGGKWAAMLTALDARGVTSVRLSSVRLPWLLVNPSSSKNPTNCSELTMFGQKSK